MSFLLTLLPNAALVHDILFDLAHRRPLKQLIHVLRLGTLLWFAGLASARVRPRLHLDGLAFRSFGPSEIQFVELKKRRICGHHFVQFLLDLP